MKKSILAILCAFCMVLMTGCDLLSSILSTTAPQVSTYEFVSEALSNTQELDEIDVEMKMNISFSVIGQSMNIPMTVTCKGKGLHSESPVIASNVNMSVLGQSTQMDMYQEGTWAYITTQGTSFKADISEGNQYDQTGTATDMIQDLPKELLEDCHLERNVDGTYTAYIDIPQEVFSEIYGEMLESINNITGNASTANVAIKNAKVKLTIIDSYVTVFDMSFAMDVSVMSMSTSSSITATVTYNNPGQPVTITPPSDYQNFPDISDLYG